MTLFICTTGTSIAGGPVKDAETADEYRKRIDDKVVADRASAGNRRQFLIKASAELNALARGDCGADDQVAYLVSETEDGRLCGESLVSLTQSELGSRARSLTVDGLQVRDGRRFRRVGVHSLFARLDRLVNETEEKIELNATGGFKGVVPYLTLYGMFHDLPISYIYEQSNTVIRLPRIPLAFDWRRLKMAERAVVKLGTDWLPENEFRALLPAGYWDPDAKADYECLFEHEDGYVGLSAVGLLMNGKLGLASEETEVLLSVRAQAALEAAEQEVRSHYEFMLARVRNPLLRAAYRHTELLRKSNLKVWKRYGQSGPRMLYWTEASRVLVGELMQHDEYTAYVNGNPRQRSDYREGDFSPWSGAVAFGSRAVVDALLADDE